MLEKEIKRNQNPISAARSIFMPMIENYILSMLLEIVEMALPYIRNFGIVDIFRPIQTGLILPAIYISIKKHIQLPLSVKLAIKLQGLKE